MTEERRIQEEHQDFPSERAMASQVTLLQGLICELLETNQRLRMNKPVTPCLTCAENNRKTSSLAVSPAP